MASEETNQALNDAVNLICEYVKNNMPDDWELELIMSRDEAFFNFIDPDGDIRDEHQGGDTNEIIAACEYANEYAFPINNSDE